MKRRTILVPALVVGLAVGGLAVSQVFAASNSSTNSPNSTLISNAPWSSNGFGGMMGAGFNPNGGQRGTGNGSGNGWSGMMGSRMNSFFGQGKTISPSDAERDMNASLQNATVDKAGNSITYSGQSVKIVIFGGAMGDSGSGSDEKFVIGGLVNPTIHVPNGAQVTLELVNEDNMPHGLEITAAQPPYGTMSMMQDGIYPGAFLHPIAAATKDQYPVATTTFTASQSGEYNYICPYPGHAAKGMYGKIIVG